MQRVRESLALLLIVVLPLHALLVTVGTKMIAGPGHAPLAVLAMWKEGVVLVLCGMVALEWIFKKNPKSEIRNKFKIQNIAIDCLDLCIIGLFIIALLLSYPLSPTPTPYPLLLGFKYTLFPLFLFFILRRVSWSHEFMERAQSVLMGVGVVVALYGIVTFFLPMRFFTRLGYSDLHSLYLPSSPLAAFQQIGETGLRRIQSTFSGPNQMGVWLLLPIVAAIAEIRNPKSEIRNKFKIQNPKIQMCFLLILVTALVLTFSRAAWVGAGVMVVWTLFRVVPRYAPHPCMHGFVGLTMTCKGAGLLGMTRSAIIMCIGIALFVALLFFPNILLRKESTLDHIRRPVEAMRVIMAHPLGLGLGSAGPASNRVSDPCVYLAKGADPSWAKDRPELCVFVGDTQVQPEEPCRCPLLPENWYLQVGVELGIIGFILFVVLVVLLIHRLTTDHFSLAVAQPFACHGEPDESIHGNGWAKAGPITTAFVGISIAALFLHAWEDSAVAYTVWMLLAAALPVAPWRRGS